MLSDPVALQDPSTAEAGPCVATSMAALDSTMAISTGGDELRRDFFKGSPPVVRLPATGTHDRSGGTSVSRAIATCASRGGNVPSGSFPPTGGGSGSYGQVVTTSP